MSDMGNQETLIRDDCMYPEDELRAATASPLPRQVALYRFYDAHEQLLYVGISNDPRRRWKQHAQEKPWYSRVRHQALSWYGSEAEARAAEIRAIRRERPEFNVAGAIRPERARCTLRPHRWVLFALAWFGVLQVLTCVMAIAHPTPLVRAIVIPCTVAAVIMAPVATLAAVVVAGAPAFRQFGSWIERNSAPYPGEGAQ